MSPETEPPAAAPAVEAPKARSSVAFVLTVLPVMAGVAWLGALACAYRLNDFTKATWPLYDWPVPGYVAFILIAASLACGGVAVWRKGLYWSYAAAAPLIPIATGSRLLLERDLIWILPFAAFVFLVVEYLSAPRRFEQIVRATETLAGSEAKPVRRFVLRYLIASIVLVVAYAGFLFGFLWVAVPGIAGLISRRAGQSLEIESSWGITIFALLLFALPLLGRIVWDGVRQFREQRRKERKELGIESPAALTPVMTRPQA